MNLSSVPRFLISAALIATLSACATHQAPKASDGPVALIVPHQEGSFLSTLDLLEIDGKPTSVASTIFYHKRRQAVAVKPGPHTLKVSYTTAGFMTCSGSSKLSLDAKAGKTYVIRAKELSEQACGDVSLHIVEQIGFSQLPAGELAQALATKDPVELRTKAGKLVRAPALGKAQQDAVAQRLSDGLGSQDPVMIDALAWLCKVLGKHGDGRYRQFLVGIADSAKTPEKLRKHAKNAAQELRSSPGVEPFVATATTAS